MTDILTPEQRSRNMAAIKCRHTKPEQAVRSLLHGLGYRFRLHGKELAGKPDLVLPKFKAVVFVHGCFWHMHSCRWGSVTPKTNYEFWRRKREGNVARDARTLRALRELGWRIITVWECETRDLDKLARRLQRLLPRD